MTKTSYEHIILNDQNIPTIKNTSMKLTELVASKRAYGWSPEELHFQYPYLSLGQIYSALSYYSDHQKEIDEVIEKISQNVKNAQPSESSPISVDSLKTRL